MTDWDAVLTELRAARIRLDQIAAKVAGERQREELWPVYSCGHRHSGREEAIACKRRMEAEDAA